MVLSAVVGCGGSSGEADGLRDAGPGADGGNLRDAAQMRDVRAGDVQVVADVGDGDAADAGASCLLPVVAQHDCLHHWRFAGDDGLTRLSLLLLPDPLASPTKGTDAFTLVGAAGSHPAGGPFCVTDTDDLDYQVTHHNLEDAATVTVGDYELSYEETWHLEGKTFRLRIERRSTSQPVLDIALQKVDCAAEGQDAAQPSCLSCRSKCCS